MHWGYYENADKDMKRIVKDIKKRPQLLKCLPGRQRKIIKVYRFSSWLGFLNLMHYKNKGNYNSIQFYICRMHLYFLYIR